MATNIAEVVKLGASPILYDNDERTWLDFRFKLENYLTLVQRELTRPPCSSERFATHWTPCWRH